MSADSQRIPHMEGDLAYPRRNGEPVFDAPWQSRAFGMVVALHTRGIYPWDDFKELLIDEIAKESCGAAPPDTPQYYYQWVDAFTRLLAAKGIVSEPEVVGRADEFSHGLRREIY